MHAQSGDRLARMSLIVTPHWVGTPARLGDQPRWGLATQLYSVRSPGSWGTGDLTDLTDLGTWAAVAHGADYVLVNPLHAAEPVAPMEPSPYLPTSRRFVNPMYLRPELIPEYAALAPAERAGVHALQEKAGDPVSERIDRDTAWTAKREALLKIFAVASDAGAAVGLRRVPPPRGPRPRRLRHLGRDRRGARLGLAGLAGLAQAPRPPGRDLLS